MICPKCKKELADNAKFCKFCGSPIAQNVTQHISLETGKPLTQNVAKPVQNTVLATGNSLKTEVNKNNKKSSKKKIIIAVIAVILALLIALGAIFIPKFIESKKISDAEKELTKILEESTTKPIVEMNCRDYDSDGTYEAYAIVGETDGEDEEHPEFYDADIYYVNLKKAQPIKENVSGKTNGYIELEEITYISIEVYTDGEDDGKSFIYTVEDNKPAESDVSGKYSNVHQEGDKVVGLDENGEEVNVEITPPSELKGTPVCVLSRESTKIDNISDDVLSDIDSLSSKKLYTYNDIGLIIKYEMKFEKESLVIDYEYDENYNITKETCWTVSEEYGTELFYKNICSYDANGNITEEKTYDEEEKYMEGVKYEYNSDNLITQITNYDKNDVITQQRIYEYNSDNLKTKETTYDENGEVEFVTSYEYDANKNLIKESSEYTEYLYSYNEKNQLITETVYEHFNEKVYTYTYDGNGNCIEKISTHEDVEGTHKIEKFEYDENNRLVYYYKYDYEEEKEFEKTYAYDKNGNIISESSNSSEGQSSTSSVEYITVYVPDDALEKVLEQQKEYAVKPKSPFDR